MASITLMMIILISLVSILGFNNNGLVTLLQFNASQIMHRHQYYRFFTHAFVHANWEHLIVNMIVLFSFGTAVEHYFYLQFGSIGTFYYLGLLFASIPLSSMWSFFRERNNLYYNAVGASGAVSAVLFAAIFFNPWEEIYFFGILPMPGIIFGVLYLYYSFYMSHKKMDNIGHDAHFLGAVIGFTAPILLRPSLFWDFIAQLF